MSAGPARCCARTIQRRLGLSLQEALGVCLGGVSLDGSPIFIREPGWYSVLTIRDKGRKQDVPRSFSGKRLPRYATRDFCASSKEYRDLVSCGLHRSVIDKAMLEASFSNLATHDYSEGAPTFEMRTACISRIMLRERGAKLYKVRGRTPGILLNLLRGRVPEAVLQRYAAVTGYDVSAVSRYASMASQPVASPLGVPYQEAARAAHSCPPGSFYIQELSFFI